MDADGPGGGGDDNAVDVNNPLNFFADTNVRIIINRKCVYSGAQKATVILFERMSSPVHTVVAAPSTLPDVAATAAEYTH